jgi:hypothetical protein
MLHRTQIEWTGLVRARQLLQPERMRFSWGRSRDFPCCVLERRGRGTYSDDEILDDRPRRRPRLIRT